LQQKIGFNNEFKMQSMCERNFTLEARFLTHHRVRKSHLSGGRKGWRVVFHPRETACSHFSRKFSGTQIITALHNTLKSHNPSQISRKSGENPAKNGPKQSKMLKIYLRAIKSHVYPTVTNQNKLLIKDQ